MIENMETGVISSDPRRDRNNNYHNNGGSTGDGDDYDDDYDDDHSIIREVTSIETELVRPSAACCYCAEPVAKRTPKPSGGSTSTSTSTSTNRKMTTAETAAENPKTGTRRPWRRPKVMASMLSDDDDYDDDDYDHNSEEDDIIAGRHGVGDGDGDEEDAAPEETVYHETGTTIAECEARFLAELEGSEMEHTNWENSLWKKGFDFVRS